MKLFNKKKKNQEAGEKEITKEVASEEIKETALPSAPALPKGGDARSYQAVLSPHITEKGTILAEQNKYLFRVANDANKIEIKKAVESLYKVKVDNVHVLYAPSKFRQVGRFKGNKSGFKKAVVTLKEGNKIDLAA